MPLRGAFPSMSRLQRPRVWSPRRCIGVSPSHFLNLLDGFKALNGVLVIATCNEPDKLDPAAWTESGDLSYRSMSNGLNCSVKKEEHTSPNRRWKRRPDDPKGFPWPMSRKLW